METQAGAVPHEQIDWTTIDWRTANQNVRRLQARIVKATQEGSSRCHQEQPPRRAGNSGLDAQSDPERVGELPPARRE